MTLRIKFSPRALADLDSIWDYTVGRWGEEQGARYTRDIAAAVERIADNPLIGSDQENVRVGYRKIKSGSHAIYYRHSRHHVEVVRILHSSMGVGAAL